MTLRKLLTGNPGNIKEFAEMVSNKDKLVSVVVHYWIEPLQTGDEAWRGRIIYSFGNLAQTISDTAVKLVKTPRNLGRGIIGGGFEEEEWKKALLNSAKHTLDYLSQKGISYEVLFNDSP